MSDFKNKFEHDFFMTLNLLRTEPNSFQTYIKNYMATGNAKIHPVASKVLINKLKEHETGLRAVDLNREAAGACVTNLSRNVSTTDNYAKEAVNEFKNSTATNVDVYEISDHLEVSWAGSALELLVHMLLMFYGDR